MAGIGGIEVPVCQGDRQVTLPIAGRRLPAQRPITSIEGMESSGLIGPKVPDIDHPSSSHRLRVGALRDLLAPAFAPIDGTQRHQHPIGYRGCLHTEVHQASSDGQRKERPTWANKPALASITGGEGHDAPAIHPDIDHALRHHHVRESYACANVPALGAIGGIERLMEPEVVAT